MDRRTLKNPVTLILAALVAFVFSLNSAMAGKSNHKDFYVKVNEIENMHSSGKKRVPTSEHKKKKSKKSSKKQTKKKKKKKSHH